MKAAKKQKRSLPKRIKRDLKRGRGAGKLERGAIFVVVTIVTLIFVSYLSVGGVLPAQHPDATQDVNLIQVGQYDPQPAKGVLQLYALNGTTATPEPTLDPNTPQPTEVPSTVVDCALPVTGNENPGIIWADRVASSVASGNAPAIEVFYADAHALPLGSGNITAMKAYPTDNATNPNVGDRNAKDGNKFPFFPSIFLTDITTNANDTSGDVTKGGTPVPPTDVFGSWKVSGGVDPSAQNGPLLGKGADAWPAANGPGGGANGAPGDNNQAFTAEVLWKLAALKAKGQPLQPKHKYRAQIILHSGDDVGNVAEVCLNFTMP